jgi:hypothetical protein
LPPLKDHDHVDYDKAAPRSNKEDGEWTETLVDLMNNNILTDSE